MTPGFWKVPAIWPGGTCHILGGGPSLGKVDVSRLRGQRVIAINQAYKLGDWIDVLFFSDLHWFRVNRDAVRNFAGLKVSSCELHAGHNEAMSCGVHVVQRVYAQKGISDDPEFLAFNESSGACAINLAVHFGVKKIILYGYDMRRIDGRNNWHDDYGEQPDKTEIFAARFPAIAEDLIRLGITCVNATPGSALTCFPIVDPEEVLPPC